MQVVATIGAAALGVAVGTVLPLLTYRWSVPYDSAPAADCRRCRVPLPAGIRGWIGSGACLSCGGALTAPPWRYVAVTAFAFALLGWRLPNRNPAEVLLLAAWLVFAGAGIWLAAIDLYVQRLPSKILTAAATVAGSLIVGAALVSDQPGLVTTIGVAAVALGLAYLALALLVPRQLGLGDVRLAAFSGLLLGTHSWGMVVLGAALPWVLSAIVAGALLATRQLQRDALIPFGPFLVAGTLLAPMVAEGGGN